MESDDEELTTYHEAGHCVMAVLCGAAVERATIAPEEDGFHGIVDIRWPRNAGPTHQLKVALAGPVAEMIYRGEPFHPGFVPEWAHDWKQAWAICRRHTKSDPECLRRLEQTIIQIYQQFQDDRWWAAIAAVSDMLGAHDEIDHETIDYEVRNWIR